MEYATLLCVALGAFVYLAPWRRIRRVARAAWVLWHLDPAPDVPPPAVVPADAAPDADPVLEGEIVEGPARRPDAGGEADSA